MTGDAELLRRSLAEPDVFEALFDRYYDLVLRFARQRTGHDAGEDIAARTFEIAFARRASFDPSYRSARPWLLGIAANLIRHHFRDEQIHLRGLRRLPRELDLDDAADLDRAEAAMAAPLVMKAIAGLGEADRETFLLLALADASYAEIAQALGIPVGTVRSRINRVRRLLRELLRDLPAIMGEGGEEPEDG